MEPEQYVERTIELPDESQPIYAEGYHKPAATHPDEAVFDVISDIMDEKRDDYEDWLDEQDDD